MNITIAIIDGPLEPRSEKTAEIFRHTYARMILRDQWVDVGGFLRARTTLDTWIEFRRIFQRSGFHLTWPSDKDFPEQRGIERLIAHIKGREDGSHNEDD